MNQLQTDPCSQSEALGQPDWIQALSTRAALKFASLPVTTGALVGLALGVPCPRMSQWATAVLCALLAVMLWLFVAWFLVVFRKQCLTLTLQRVAKGFLWNYAGLLLWLPVQKRMAVDYRVSLMLFGLGGMCFIAFLSTLLTLSLRVEGFQGEVASPALHEQAEVDVYRKVPFVRCWLALLIVAGLWHLAVSAIARHNLWLTFTSDLGIMDQTLWNTAHGRLLTFTLHGKSEFRPIHGRMELMYLPLSLLYWIRSDPRTALFAQALFVALGAIPLFLLAREKLRSEGIALFFVMVYFLHPAVQGVTLASIHGNALALPFLLFAFYFIEKNDGRWFLLHSALALSCREDVGFVLAFMGLYAMRRRKMRAGLWVFVGSVAWIALVLFVLPRVFHRSGGLSHEASPQEMFGHLRTGIFGMLKWMTRSPTEVVHEIFSWENAYYLFGLLAPLAFLPLLCPSLLSTIAPALALHLVSGWVLMKNLQSQYPATFLPAIFAAGICGMGRITGKVGREIHRQPSPPTSSRRETSSGGGRWASGLIIFLFLTGLFLQRLFGKPEFPHSFWDSRHIAAMEQTVEEIPPDASVSASQHLGPRLSQRPLFYADDRWQSADYIICDTDEPFLWLPLSKRPGIRFIDPYEFPAMRSGEFGVVRNLDGVLTLRRGVDAATSMTRLYLAEAKSSPPPVSIGERLSLIEAQLQPRKSATGGFIEITLRWRVRHSPSLYPMYRLICATKNEVLFWDRQPTFGRLRLSMWPSPEARTDVLDRFFARIDRNNPGGPYRFYLDRSKSKSPTCRGGHVSPLTESAYPLGAVNLPDLPSAGDTSRQVE